MSIAVDDEILQDFMVEAGELLEHLGEQLVELEQRPRDADLLNAVFRAFHTIKGGAGFLNLHSMVAICHRAEDVFNCLRQGERILDAGMMDAVLQVVDILNGMFTQLQQMEMPSPADPDLLERLHALTQPVSAAAPPPPAPVAAPPPPPPSAPKEPPKVLPQGGSTDDITDDEFEALLDALNAQEELSSAPAVQQEVVVVEGATGEDITEAEFENLLDQLHGQGRFRGPPKSSPKETSPLSLPAPKPVERSAPIVAAPITPTPAASTATPPPSATPADAHETPKAVSAETTVRVDTRLLDNIMNMVGELVLVRNRLVNLQNGRADDETSKAVGHLDLVTANLQNEVMKTRMQPIKKVFGRFPRVVRDLARSLNKEINLVMEGEDTDLDKNLVEALADPLVHLVRNAVDHGIESTKTREKSGKSKVGTVVLSAAQEGDHILLTIADDGAGMDAEVLRRKVVEKGLMDPEVAARLDNRECFELIFLPGFSTKSEISDVSGRGVGMDVVKTRLNQLNGSIEINSRLGAGTTLSMKVPLTLAILPTLMVVLRRQIFALPLVNVSEIFHLDLAKTNVVDGQRVVMVRNKPLPLFYLRRWLIQNDEEYDFGKGFVVVVNVGTQRFGFVVDQLIGQEEVVIKPLGALLHGIQGLAGATITGDGRISLILDVPSLIKTYSRLH
ncbi:two-component system, chemotaxis family, sensor kinase CheA [Gammaproteobacteria bacterium]